MVKKTIEEIYKKKDLHQHILDRPDTYIGANKIVCENSYVFNQEQNGISRNIIEYNPGLIKIFDEILVNAIDHTVRDSSANIIKVNIDSESGSISIYNNGKGIPVVIHKEEKLYIPEMIFGNFLTSSNYNDNENRIVGGVNGLGAKLAAVFSKNFIIDTIDSERGLHYYQEFSNNMFTKNEPIIKKSNKKAYTQITFIPDYKRFNLTNLNSNIISLLYKRVYDCTACTNKNVSVYLNNEKLKQKDFVQYIELYTKEKIFYENFADKEFLWEYSVVLHEGYDQVSFVNGICTYQGGKHVDYILNQIIKKLTDMIVSKKKITNLKPSYIKERLFIFVRSTIVNPSFASQSKELLTTPVKDFGCKVEVSDSFINKLYKSGIVEDLISFTKYKNNKDLKKTDNNTRRKNKLFIENLDDAEYAGTNQSHKCTLILTEGLSAKTFAISGLSVVGREYYGVFPLKGKVLNIREATHKQLMENKEINNIKQIIGLQHGRKYTSIKELRYSKICILTDADVDGIHIRSLLVNFFHTWWPELLNIKGFITSMKTPIVKAKKSNKEVSFYTIQDFNEWLKNNDNNNWKIKYYKGLGTSNSNEAKDLFKNINNQIINYVSDNTEKTDNSLLLAFDKKHIDNRKKWLQNYKSGMVLDQSKYDISYHDLINKELIHFSMYDILRSIPSICDGFKPSQRKVIHTLLNKKYKGEIKVAQLGASVAEYTSYHHGEASLYGTIINMAQDFTGSNNINLLVPEGQFGSRLTSNGSDAASPRYIYTKLNEITKKLFNENDLKIVNYLEDDGNKIEPEFFVPILPLILINGSIGIGTGYSTNIPCHNPKEIISNIKKYIDGHQLKPLKPWYKNYKGEIIEKENGDFIIKGKYTVKENNIIISEIPIGTGISDYKEFLEKLISEENSYNINNYINKSTENNVYFELEFKNKKYLQDFLQLDLEKILKLSKNISTKNFHLFNENGKITKYESANDILIEFVNIRLKYNIKRKKYIQEELLNNLKILKNKLRFLQEIINSKLVIYKKSKDDIVKLLKEREYDPIPDYNYLISMPIYSFTKEKIEEINTKINDISEYYNDIKNKNEKDLLIDDLNLLDI